MPKFGCVRWRLAVGACWLGAAAGHAVIGHAAAQGQASPAFIYERLLGSGDPLPIPATGPEVRAANLKQAIMSDDGSVIGIADLEGVNSPVDDDPDQFVTIDGVTGIVDYSTGGAGAAGIDPTGTFSYRLGRYDAMGRVLAFRQELNFASGFVGRWVELNTFSVFTPYLDDMTFFGVPGPFEPTPEIPPVSVLIPAIDGAVNAPATFFPTNPADDELLGWVAAVPGAAGEIVGPVEGNAYTGGTFGGGEITTVHSFAARRAGPGQLSGIARVEGGLLSAGQFPQIEDLFIAQIGEQANFAAFLGAASTIESAPPGGLFSMTETTALPGNPIAEMRFVGADLEESFLVQAMTTDQFVPGAAADTTILITGGGDLRPGGRNIAVARVGSPLYGTGRAVTLITYADLSGSGDLFLAGFVEPGPGGIPGLDDAFLLFGDPASPTIVFANEPLPGDPRPVFGFNLGSAQGVISEDGSVAFTAQFLADPEVGPSGPALYIADGYGVLRRVVGREDEIPGLEGEVVGIEVTGQSSSAANGCGQFLVNITTTELGLGSYVRVRAPHPDRDCDGMLTPADAQAFLLRVQFALPTGDANGDGAVDFLDVIAHQAEADARAAAEMP